MTEIVNILVFAALYFIPTLNGYSRRHPQACPIMIINLCLGWTGLGWILALAWSESSR